MKELTVQDYAALRGITPGAVRKAIKLKHNLPGVTKLSKFGKVHVLTVNEKKINKSLVVS